MSSLLNPLKTKQLITRSVTLANTSSVESTRIQSIRSQAETAARFVICKCFNIAVSDLIVCKKEHATASIEYATLL